MLKRFLIFIILNFGALAIAGLFTGGGVASEWYQNMDKAPWTPPGWAFGAAWTTIMICFSIYLAYLWPWVKDKKFLIGLFVVQWILNVSWSPVFFQLQEISWGLVIINLLAIAIGFFLFAFRRILQWKTVFILPYFLWLMIATSLNAYIYLYN